LKTQLPDGPPEDGLRLVDEVWEAVKQLAPHAHLLRTLAGKDMNQRHRTTPLVLQDPGLWQRPVVAVQSRKRGTWSAQWPARRPRRSSRAGRSHPHVSPAMVGYSSRERSH